MTTLREAAQAVLDRWDSPRWTWHLGPTADLMATLRAALAEPVQEPEPGEYHGWVLREVLFDNGEPIGHREPVQEPVAWMVYTLDGKSVCVTDNPADFTDQHKVLPLYTMGGQR